MAPDQAPPRDDTAGAGAPGTTLPSALPSPLARFLAFLSIVVAGACGGLIGWAVVDLQMHGDSSLWPGVGGVVGAVIAASGVAVVAVLVLRAMNEWQTIRERKDASGAG